MLEQEPVETIHVYIVKEEEEQPIVDSSVHNTAKIDTQPLVRESYPTHGQLVPYLIMAAHLLIVLSALSIHFYTLLTETATIIIVPNSYHLTAHLSLSNIQSRIFQPVTLTQRKTVPATGKGHQDPIQARGTITLYNSATSEQTIDTGTLFIGSDEVHIVTDQTAVIAGATPPLEGQTTVSAHAVNAGAAGNIQAGDISGACCRENIFAYNSAFSGGADERNYSVVTQRDIQEVVSSVLPHLTESIHASFQQQIRPGELLTPNQCSQKISTDRNIGDEATTVTVIVSESCLAGAYTSSDFQAKVQQALSQQAGQRIGTGYLLSSYVPTSPIKANIQQGTLVMSAIYQATMIYHFSSHELITLRQQLAGKTRQQGITILSHLNGADHLTVQVGKNATFPIDSTHINILIVP